MKDRKFLFDPNFVCIFGRTCSGGLVAFVGDSLFVVEYSLSDANILTAAWRSGLARKAHNLEVTGSIPVVANCLGYERVSNFCCELSLLCALSSFLSLFSKFLCADWVVFLMQGFLIFDCWRSE